MDEIQEEYEEVREEHYDSLKVSDLNTAILHIAPKPTRKSATDTFCSFILGKIAKVLSLT